MAEGRRESEGLAEPNGLTDGASSEGRAEGVSEGAAEGADVGAGVAPLEERKKTFFLGGGWAGGEGVCVRVCESVRVCGCGCEGRESHEMGKGDSQAGGHEERQNKRRQTKKKKATHHCRLPDFQKAAPEAARRLPPPNARRSLAAAAAAVAAAVDAPLDPRVPRVCIKGAGCLRGREADGRADLCCDYEQTCMERAREGVRIEKE